MENLQDNWLTEGRIDFEYKKYVLLAYLQSIDKNFTRHRLYPFLADLVRHYQGLLKFRTEQEETARRFPKELSEIDLKTFMLHYERTVQDDSLMQEISRIVDFSLPRMRRHLDEGKEIYEWIEQQLMLRPVGIIPLELRTGYLFLRNGEERDTNVYLYQLTLFEQSDEKYRGIMTQYVSTYTVSITSTYESIKAKLIDRQKLLVPPAVYVVESEVTVPLTETLLPIAKRVLVRHLMEQERAA